MLNTDYIKQLFAGGEAPVDNKHILQHAIDWAMHAGKIQIEQFRTQIAMGTKSSRADLVTEVDKKCEDYLLGKIAETYPTHSILGEESGMHDKSSEWEWVIDPLDGTNNYAQGLPIFCVSIGVRYQGVTQVGVVYAPVLDDLFIALKGRGANWNGREMHVSRKTELIECMVGTGFPYDKGMVGSDKNNLDNVCRILPQVRGLRRMGSAAYDLCCVGAGLLDGYWEQSLKPWDACAGCLIVEEAGGRIVSFREDRDISIVAGSESVVKLLLNNVK